jgi:nitrite reductase/ring-hydroxylating ferredoxin subunit
VIDVGSAAEFAEGTVAVRRAGTQEVGVIRWGDRLYAVRNVCPHQSAPVCRGWLRPMLTGPSPGSPALARDERRPLLSCPWHGWEFDVGSGRALFSDRMRLRTYGIEVRDGRVLVDLKRHGDGDGAPSAECGPAVATGTER